MGNLKEFTRQEFNEFVEKNNLEVFTERQVKAFCKDTLEKSQKGEIDEFELNCAAADSASLKEAIVWDEGLQKSIYYYRESQREPIENLPDGIFKSMNDTQCLRYKETPLNIFKGIAGINCADEDALEKAKALPVGTEKTYGGKLYVKTEKGWRLKGKGKKDSSKTDKEVDHSEHASEASDKQLQAAVKDKDASSEVKQAAQKEIENRKDEKKDKILDNKTAGELRIASALKRILDAQKAGELDLDESVISEIKKKLAKK